MRDKLEKKIVDKPDDLARHEELAAWLEANGDEPRAELIRLHIAMENTHLNREKRFELELVERRLLEAHGRKWIGELGDFVLLKPTSEQNYRLRHGCKVLWYRGWVRGLQLDELTLKLSKVLLHAPEMRLFNTLILTEPVNASCDYLHEWGLLEKLKHIDLSYGRISDKGAQTLAADRNIKKLDSLDLSGNQITEEGLAPILKTFPKVQVDDQSPIEVSRDDVPAAEVAEEEDAGSDDDDV
ncbi:hypothetical protein GC176_07710 [bacterium]|nr:hypothetical protein [bacterium]